MPLRIRPLLLFAGLALALSAKANVHLGKQGATWPITEPDMRQVMAQQMTANPAYAKAQADMKAQAKDWFTAQSGIALPVTSKDAILSFTPEWTLPDDKYHLVQQPDGKYAWEVLYHKGTKVYPLRAMRPPSWLLVFDADHPDQVVLAREMVKAAKPLHVTLKLIATRGNLDRAMKDIGQIVYLLPPSTLARIPIPSTPALVGEKASVSDHLSIIVQAAPYRPDAMLAATR